MFSSARIALCVVATVICGTTFISGEDPCCKCVPKTCIDWNHITATPYGHGWDAHGCTAPSQTCPQDTNEIRSGVEQVAIWEVSDTFCRGCSNIVPPVVNADEGKIACVWERCVTLTGCATDGTKDVEVTFTPKFKYDLTGFQSLCCDLEYDIDCDGDDDDVCCPNNCQPTPGKCNSGWAEIKIFARPQLRACETEWKVGEWFVETIDINVTGVCTSSPDSTSGNLTPMAIKSEKCKCTFTSTDRCGGTGSVRQVEQKVELVTKINLFEGLNARWLKWRDQAGITVVMTDDKTTCAVK